MCVSVCVLVHAAAQLAMEMARYKESFSMLHELHFGREILEGILNTMSCNKTMHGTAAIRKFTPP